MATSATSHTTKVAAVLAIFDTLQKAASKINDFQSTWGADVLSEDLSLASMCEQILRYIDDSREVLAHELGSSEGEPFGASRFHVNAGHKDPQTPPPRAPLGLHTPPGSGKDWSESPGHSSRSRRRSWSPTRGSRKQRSFKREYSVIGWSDLITVETRGRSLSREGVLVHHPSTPTSPGNTSNTTAPAKISGDDDDLSTFTQGRLSPFALGISNSDPHSMDIDLIPPPVFERGALQHLYPKRCMENSALDNAVAVNSSNKRSRSTNNDTELGDRSVKRVRSDSADRMPPPPDPILSLGIDGIFGAPSVNLASQASGPCQTLVTASASNVRSKGRRVRRSKGYMW